MYQRLLNVINDKGISRYRLSKLANITPQDMYALLSGKRPLFPAWKKRICDALQMDEEELFPSEEGDNQ